MAILSKGINFSTGEQVTADKLDALVDSATFVNGAVDNSTTQLSGGAIIVKDSGITTNKIASGVNISFNDGSAAAPSITNNGDTNTGIFFPEDDHIGLSVGGVEKARLNSTGSIIAKGDSSGYYFFMPALGTDAFTNASRLEIRKDPSNPDFRLTTFSGGAGPLNNLFVGTDRDSYAFFHINGNVGIGTISPATKLDVNGAVTVTGGITVSDGVRGGLKLGTAQFPTSGNSIEFTGIPSWAKRVTIVFSYVSAAGTNPKQFQLGTSSAYATTGYAGSMSNSSGYLRHTTGLGLRSSAAADACHGTAVFTNFSGNTWMGVCNFSLSNADNGGASTSVINLSSQLNKIRLVTTGDNSFTDADVNIICEG